MTLNLSMLFCDTIFIHSVTLGAMLHVQLMFFHNKFYNFVKVVIDSRLSPPLTPLYCLPFTVKLHTWHSIVVKIFKKE